MKKITKFILITSIDRVLEVEEVFDTAEDAVIYMNTQFNEIEDIDKLLFKKKAYIDKFGAWADTKEGECNWKIEKINFNI